MVQPKAEGRSELAGAEEQVAALLDLLRGAERSVRILSDALDPALFDHEPLAAELSRLVRTSRQCEVRILVKDSQHMVKRSHHLATLHRRLVSSVQVRKLTQFPEHYVTNYVIVDTRGILLLPMQDDKVCFANADDRALAKHFAEQFDELWSRSGPDPELRVMPM
jgi:signal transduction histidine kinase